jgi:hypothetical protein
MTVAVAPQEAPSSLQDQLAVWLTDFKQYAEDLPMIQTTKGTMEPFRLNNVQLAVLGILEDIRLEGRFVRVIILKLRRAGISTLFAGRNFWHTSLTPHTNALMVTHEPEATDTIFTMHKRFYAQMPGKLKPKVLYDNRKVLEFNTKSRVGGIDSTIRVGTAGKENFGSSQLVNFGHFSEFSKWPTHCIGPLMTSLMPCIPKTLESEVIIESTAFGIGNQFHTMYWDAKYKYEMYLDAHGELAWRMAIDEKAPAGNTWSAIFIPWFVFEVNQLPVTQWERQTGLTFVRDKAEEEIAQLYLTGCSDAQANQKLAWRRLSIIDDFKGDIKKFNQENPPTAKDAFHSSGEPAFDTNEISARLKAAPLPIARYEIDPLTGQFLASPTGRLWVWEEPQAGEAYFIPADVARGIVIDEGTESAQVVHDFSTASVKHQLSGREVAQWHGKIDPDLFGLLLGALGRRYNEAWLVPERNNHGGTVIAALIRLKYKKIYVEVMEQPPFKKRREWGFDTQGGRDGGIRAEAMNAFIAAVRDKKDGIRSSRTLDEMLSLKRNLKGQYVAEAKHHDDCCVVEAIAKFVGPKLPLPAAALILRHAQAQAQLPPPPVATAQFSASEGWT